MACKVCSGTSLQGSCGCGNGIESNAGACCDAQPAVPLPTNTCAAPCPEDHCVTIETNSYALAVKVKNSWNIPECGETAVLYIPDITLVHPGSYIWGDAYGYFEIVGFNASTKEITIQNNCTDGNEPPGTEVPECSTFIVTDPPAAGSESTDICLELDFTAPNNGACILITLTTTAGIEAGDLVQIGSGTYRVNAVNSGTVIEICNDGDGITPGTPVIAKNAAGDYQYCLIVVSQNPCSLDPETSGTVLSCNEDGLIRKLGGAAVGEVLVCTDAGNQLAEWQAPPCCASWLTTLTAFGGTLTPCSDFENDDGGVTQIGVSASGTVDTGNPTLETASNAIVFTNESSCRDGFCMITVNMRVFANIANAFTDELEVLFEIIENIDGGGDNVVVNMDETFFPPSNASRQMDRQFTWTTLIGVAGGQVRTYAARGRVTWQGNGGSSYVIDGLDVTCTGILVAV